MTREDAVDFLVSRRFSAPTVKQANLGAIKNWFVNDLSRAQQGALLGALGGGGIGLVSILASDDEDRSWWGDTVTVVLGGGAAGLGAGALIGALQNRAKNVKDKREWFDEHKVKGVDDIANALHRGDIAEKDLESLTELDPSLGAEIKTVERELAANKDWNLFSGAKDLMTPDTGSTAADAALLGVAGRQGAKDVAQVGGRVRTGQPRYSIDPSDLERVKHMALAKTKDGFTNPASKARLDAFLKENLGMDPKIRSYWIDGDTSASKAFYEALKKDKGAYRKVQGLIHELVEANPDFNPNVMRSGDRSILGGILDKDWTGGSKQLNRLSGQGPLKRLPSFYGGSVPKQYTGSAPTKATKALKGLAGAAPYLAPAIGTGISGALGSGGAASDSEAQKIQEAFEAYKKKN